MSGPILPHGSPHAKDDISYIKRSQAGGRSSHQTRSGRRVFPATPQANAAQRRFRVQTPRRQLRFRRAGFADPAGSSGNAAPGTAEAAPWRAYRFI